MHYIHSLLNISNVPVRKVRISIHLKSLLGKPIHLGASPGSLINLGLAKIRYVTVCAKHHQNVLFLKVKKKKCCCLLSYMLYFVQQSFSQTLCTRFQKMDQPNMPNSGLINVIFLDSQQSGTSPILVCDFLPFHTISQVHVSSFETDFFLFFETYHA